MAGEIVMILDDLPKDLPTFMARFGTDQQCRDYLFAARWPEGFRCLACGHADAYALRARPRKDWAGSAGCAFLGLPHLEEQRCPGPPPPGGSTPVRPLATPPTSPTPSTR